MAGHLPLPLCRVEKWRALLAVLTDETPDRLYCSLGRPKLVRAQRSLCSLEPRPKHRSGRNQNRSCLEWLSQGACGSHSAPSPPSVCWSVSLA